MSVAPLLDLADERGQHRMKFLRADPFDFGSILQTERPLFCQFAQDRVAENHVRRASAFLRELRAELTETPEQQIVLGHRSGRFPEFFPSGRRRDRLILFGHERRQGAFQFAGRMQESLSFR